MSDKDQRVAVITGGSQGIGAGLVAGHRRLGWWVADHWASWAGNQFEAP